MLYWAPSRFETGDGYFRFDHAKCVVSDHEVKIGTANFDCPAAVLACSITSVKLPAMIILDTNVVSELLRPSPSEQVISWIASQPLESLYTTSITQAEMLYSRMDVISRCVASRIKSGDVMILDGGSNQYANLLTYAHQIHDKPAPTI